jgi:hypothetical protein
MPGSHYCMQLKLYFFFTPDMHQVVFFYLSPAATSTQHKLKINDDNLKSSQFICSSALSLLSLIAAVV